MRSLSVALGRPHIEIGLHVLNPPGQPFPERNVVEPVPDGSVKALAGAGRLRAVGHGLRMIHILERQMEQMGIASPDLPERAVLMPCRASKGMTRSLSRSATGLVQPAFQALLEALALRTTP